MSKTLVISMLLLFFQTTAWAKANLVFEETEISFGTTVPYHQVAKLIRIKNIGDNPAAFYSDSFSFKSKQGFYWVSSKSCEDILNPGAGCTVRVVSDPRDVGTIEDMLSMAYYDSTDSSLNGMQTTLSLSTVVVSPANLEISDGPNFDFGVVTPGNTRTHTFTVKNSGEFPAQGMAYSIHPGRPFGFLGGQYPGTGGTCRNSLVYKQSCTIVIEYWPTLPGVDHYVFGLAYFDGASNLSSTIDLHGTGK